LFAIFGGLLVAEAVGADVYELTTTPTRETRNIWKWWRFFSQLILWLKP